MNCGVPFSQAGMNIMGMTSGCPLHNLVPEWNDLLSVSYTHLYEEKISDDCNNVDGNSKYGSLRREKRYYR